MEINLSSHPSASESRFSSADDNEGDNPSKPNPTHKMDREGPCIWYGRWQVRTLATAKKWSVAKPDEIRDRALAKLIRDTASD